MKENRKNNGLGVVLPADLPATPYLKEGISTLLQQGFALRLRISLFPGRYEEALETAGGLRRIIPREKLQDLDVVEPGKNFFPLNAPPKAILAAISWPCFLYRVLESVQRDSREIPLVIALLPGSDALPREIAPFFHLPGLFWVPFGWFPGKKEKNILLSRGNLWGKTCRLALRGKQLQPVYLEYAT